MQENRLMDISLKIGQGQMTTTKKNLKSLPRSGLFLGHVFGGGHNYFRVVRVTFLQQGVGTYKSTQDFSGLMSYHTEKIPKNRPNIKIYGKFVRNLTVNFKVREKSFGEFLKVSRSGSNDRAVSSDIRQWPNLYNQIGYKVIFVRKSARTMTTDSPVNFIAFCATFVAKTGGMTYRSKKIGQTFFLGHVTPVSAENFVNNPKPIPKKSCFIIYFSCLYCAGDRHEKCSLVLSFG